MSRRHWLATYGQRIPAEINPDAYGSVLHIARGRHAALCGKACVSLFRPFAHLRRYRSALPQVRRLSAGEAQCPEGRSHRADGAQCLRLPGGDARHPPRRRRAGERQPALYAARVGHQLNDAGAEIIIIFTGSTPTLAEIVGNTPVKTVITVALGDVVGARHPEPAEDLRLDAVVALLPMSWPKARPRTSRRSRSAATTSCSSSTPAAPRGCRRARR